MILFSLSQRLSMVGLLIITLSVPVRAQNPDALYPIPPNRGTEIVGDVNLFTGMVNREEVFYELTGMGLKYALKGFYNSASANIINKDKSKYVANVLGGYGWKLMNYPKIVQDGSNYLLLDGQSAYKLQSLGDGVYTPGGDKYLWRVFIKNNQWRVSEGNGTHYTFGTAAVTIEGVSVWNFTSNVNSRATDSLSFDYDGKGNLVRMTNTSGDTLALGYSNSSGNFPLLTTLNHSKNGQPIATIAFKYKTYNFSNYEVLSEIFHYHQVSGDRYSQLKASTRFYYLSNGETPPLGGDNYPGAMSSIVTPTGAIYTYTYQAASVAGIPGYRVVQYAVNDGYNNNSGNVFDPNTYYAISYTDTNVLADSAGVYPQYNQVAVAPGSRYTPAGSMTMVASEKKTRKSFLCRLFSKDRDTNGTGKNNLLLSTTGDVSDYPYGNIEYYFLNGQPVASLIDLPGGYPATSITSPILQGRLYQKNINADTSVFNPGSETVNILNYWDAGYLGTGAIGGFPKLMKTYDQKYGVGGWMTYTYGTSYQLPVSIATSRRNPEPNNPLVNRDSLVTIFTYAFQKYPSLASNDNYQINQTSQVLNLVQEDMQGPFQVTGCECTQWTQWGQEGQPGASGYWAPYRYVQMRSASADTSSCHTITATTDDWLVKGTVNLRTGLGSVLDSTTVLNGTVSRIVSQGSYGEVPVATFNQAITYTTGSTHNANADFLGFEAYERDFRATWAVTGGRINSDYAHTGDQSFSGTITRTFTALAGDFYVVNAWVGMRQNGDGYSIKLVNAGGTVIGVSSGSWQSGDPGLRFVEISGYVPPGQTFTVALATQGVAFVDDVVVLPSKSAFQAKVYAIERNIQEAELGLSGATTHLVHNRFNSLIAKVGPGSIQNINDLQIPYNSRKGNIFFNNKDTFDTTYPNMMLHASARSDGNWQGFQYAGNNSFPPQNLTGMTIQDDWLIVTGANASATFNHSVDTANLALYAELFPVQQGNAGETGISMMLDSLDYNGNVISTTEIKFVLAESSIKLYSGNAVYETIPVATSLASTSMLFSVSDYNYFHGYVNGRFVFEHEFPQGKIHGPAKLIATNVGSAFDNFIYVATPTIYQETFDALQRPKQLLSRQDQDEIKISEMLYGGPLNLPVAQTRQAIIGADDTTGLSYQPDFASGFSYDSMSISSNSTLGSASYYDNPFSTSARYTKSPLLQFQNLGGGGQFTAGEQGNHYNSFTYGEDAGHIFNYTADQLLVTTQTEPNGVKVYTFTNRDEVVFGEARIEGTDTLKTQYEYDNGMRLYRTYHPNYYNKSVNDYQKYIIEYGYDFTGNRISIKTPDAGTTYYVYDPGGNLRFSVDSVGLSSSPNQIVYYKYDALNRIVEQGILNASWDRAVLQNMADSLPTFPSSGNYMWRKTFTYDGQGLNFDQGRLVSAGVNWNNDNQAEVSETYQYDEYGNVVEKGLVSAGFGGSPQVVQYEYDLENRVTLIRFPGTTHPGITYTYNGNSQIVGVGIPGDSDYYAAYDYGFETVEYLNNSSFMRTYGYNDAGWPTEINDPVWGEELAYEHANDSSYDYNGKIAGLYNTMKWSGDSISASFAYDNDARLIQADFGASNPWSLGLNTPVTYDNNGNILNLQYGTSSPIGYTYVSGTNKVNSYGSTQISYNANGSITGIQGKVNGLTYDPVSRLTLTAAFAGTTAAYHYDGQNKRVYKQVDFANGKQSKRMYVHGLNDYPLMELYRDSTGTTTTSFYIYGPKGLIAIQQNNERLFVLKDHLGSVRVVLDSANTVKAFFNYSAFGDDMSSYIDPAIAHFSLNYRFTGQEIEPELNGIYNYRARLYDPGLGRFYSADPKMQYPSPYEYVGNNPINYLDPTGEWGWFSTIVTAVAAVAVTAAVIVAAPVVLPAALAGSALAVAASAAVAGTVVGTAVGTASGMLHDGDSFGSSLGHALAISATASVVTAGGAYLAGAIPQAGGYMAAAAQDAGYLARAGFLTRSGALTAAGRSILGTIGVGLGLGVGTGALFGGNGSDPTPIVATDDGITCCEVITSQSLGITTRQIQGGFGAWIDLTKAALYVNDDSYPCSRVDCDKDPFDPTDSTYNYMLYSQRIIKGKSSESWKYIYPSWSETSRQTLYVNGGFFYPYVDSYIQSCTSNQGIWVAGNKVINSTVNNAFWAFKGESKERYYLDAIVFYKNPAAHGGKYVEIIKYNEQQFYQSDFLSSNVENGIGGVYFMRDGQDYSSQLPDSILAKEENFARLALGVTDDGKTLYILQISNAYATADDGITFSEAVPWFKAKGCNNAIMLDGSASSQLYYSYNGRTFQSRPMERMAISQRYYCKQVGITSQQFRPIMQFMGFKKKE